MSVLGIDPGTSRWGFVFLEDGEVAGEESIPTEEIKADPRAVLDLATRAQLTVAPSGYGTVLRRVADLTEDDFFEILLKRRNDKTVMGLEAVLRAIKGSSLNAYVIPGVKLLPTVAREKKQGKIDMGTPDKLCAAVAGIVDQSRRLKLHYNQTSFVLAEIGHGFDAFLAVENGRIVDGIGGTLASSTWRGEDGEILYLKGRVSKSDLKKGSLNPKNVREGALKDINKLRAEYEPREILVSGSKSEEVFDYLRKRFKIPVLKLSTAARAGNAAYGTSVIADGLNGGRFKEVVELIGIKDARGSNLDYTELG
jgi:predicted butyrate kinase (DUF1464 family)